MEPIRILIVEDEFIVARDLQAHLEKLGYLVCGRVNSGEKAFEHVQTTATDLVLMDIMLKGSMNGIEAAAAIRSRFHLPVIYVTANTNPPIMDQAKLTEPFGFIIKPFNERELHANIEMALYKHRTEQALVAQKALLDEVFNGIQEGIALVDEFFNIIFCNSAYEQTVESGPDILIGQNVFRFFEEQEQSFLINQMKIRQQIDVSTYEIPLITLKGHHKYVRITFAPRFDKNGRVVGEFVTMLDITGRKKAEEQIKNQNLLLEQAVQQKQREMETLFERLLRQEKLATIGQITSSIAHELRNPLGAVKQSAFFLNRLYQRQQLHASNPKVKEHLALIKAELDMVERIISDLLQMTRMKQPQSEYTNLRPIILDAVNRCYLPEQIHFTLNVSPEPFLILADPSQLRQVLINLFTNAMQAIEQDGSITISAKQLPEDGLCVIEIEDTGSGILSEDLGKVFEPLYTTKATGTGLGLSICKQIIEKHQGQISVKSQVGQGTTVTIVLPKE